MKSFPPEEMSPVRLTESVTMARGFSQRVRIHLNRHRPPTVWSCSGRKQWLDILLRLQLSKHHDVRLFRSETRRRLEEDSYHWREFRHRACHRKVTRGA